MSQNVFKEKVWINSIGQAIQPGDDVIFVTTGYSHNVNVRRGRFLGVNESTRFGTVNSQRVEYIGKRYRNGKFETEIVKTCTYLGRIYKIDTSVIEEGYTSV